MPTTISDCSWIRESIFARHDLGPRPPSRAIPGSPRPASAHADFATREENIILEALGNLGDFIGGIAVVVTLLYLALQIRQNTKALGTASRQEIVSGYRDANRLWFEKGAARAYANGIRSYPDLPFEERSLFVTMINDQALFFQGAFALHESGQLEDETYQAYLGWFASNIATPGGRVWWEEIGRPIYTSRMIAAVDARLSAGGLVDIRKLNFARPDDPTTAPEGI